MPRYAMNVMRTDVFTGKVVVEAESQNRAATTIMATLAEGGWDAIFADDGDYQSCGLEVIPSARSSWDRRTDAAAQFVVIDCLLQAVATSDVDAGTPTS